MRFELGVLYFRLGSYEMARSYSQTALQMRDIAPDLRERAEDLIAIIDKKLQVDQYTGYVQAGLAYQTNPGAGPGAQTVLASGRRFNSSFFSKPDWNWFGAFGLNYVHDFEDQNGDTFEASAVGYDAQEFSLHQFDIGLLEVRAGPRFGIPTGNPNTTLSIKPYLVATGAMLADAPDYGGMGGGLTLHTNVGNVAARSLCRNRAAELSQFELIPARQRIERDAVHLWAASLRAAVLRLGLAVAPRLRARQRQLRALWLRRLRGRHLAAVEFFVSRRRPTLDAHPTAGASRWLYAAPDPNIDPVLTPRSTEWRVGLGLQIAIRT